MSGYLLPPLSDMKTTIVSLFDSWISKQFFFKECLFLSLGYTWILSELWARVILFKLVSVNMSIILYLYGWNWIIGILIFNYSFFLSHTNIHLPLSYLSLFSSWVSEFHPLKGSQRGVKRSTGQGRSLSPSPPNLYDHQTAGYKRWADSKLEHSHFIPGGGLSLCIYFPLCNW